MDNMTIFDMLYPTFKIDKPIRLIELFAGVGSQAMALRDLGAKFEHYKIAEWEVSAFKSYKAIHMPGDNTDYSKDISKNDLPQILFNYGISTNGKDPMTLKEIQRKNEKWLRETYNNIKATNNLCSVCNFNGEDLGITDTDKYCYILTYSFPCQDLSVAGKMKGMSKGSNTRSGLLWEVERLLGEVKELPQVLLMENVPQVISDANIPDFHKWQKFLEDKGYTNYVDVLNAKDFGVAQNRERCFMVSLLGQWNYKFPKPIPLTKTMKDYLEDEVDERYYINSEKAQKLIQQLMESGQLEGCVGNINPSSNGINGNVYGSDGASPTITTNKGEGPKICTNISKQGAILSEYGTKLEKFTDCAMTIMARDYKGFGKQSTNGVIDEKVKQIGNYETESTWDNPQTGRVYSTDGLSPTLNTCGGGDREVKIVEQTPCKLDKMPNGHLTSLDNARICDINTPTASTITARYYKGIGAHKDNMVMESVIVASRGRNPQNPSDRTPDNYVEQRLEPNSEGLCNTLTSVQKDNMVLESTVKIKQATQQGYAECKLGGVADLSFPTSKTRRGRVQDGGDTCPTLTATETGVCRIETPYRIRKLTPLECWRLMDFTDEDFRKAEEVNSNTQLYKQAGNSIVKAVLMAIFKQMM